MDKNKIHEALKILSRSCDYAKTLDNKGFNAFDAEFGHSLAAQASLTDGQAATALKMLGKYSKQLSGAGIKLDYDPLPATGSFKEVAAVNGRIYLYFSGKPDEATRNKIKSIAGFRWHPELPQMPWSVPSSKFEQVNEMFGINLSEPTKTPSSQSIANAVDVVVTMNGKLNVSFPNPDTRQAMVNKIKTLSERNYNPNNYYWEVPLRLASELLSLFSDDNIDLKPEVKAYIDNQQSLVQLSGAVKSDIEINMRGGNLYPFQKAGIEFLELSNGRALIADEMGLGKTIQTIGYLQMHPELRPALIVVPASLKANWKREIERWITTEETIIILNGRKPYPLDINPATIYIINYDVLAAWTDELIKGKPGVVIADEAHYIKNYRGMNNKASPKRAKALAKLSHNCKNVIFLTGTPVTNRPIELYPLLNLIDHNSWGSWWNYAKRYCGMQQTAFGLDFSGATNLDELHDKIKPYVIRRTKSQVLTELPDKTRANVVVEFGKQSRSNYNQMLSELRRKNTIEIAAIEKLKQVAAEGKLSAAFEWIDNFLEGDEKLVVFAHHKNIIAAVMDRYQDIAVKLTGDTSMADRQANIDAFQDNPNVRLFVSNIKAGGVGVTLTAASNVVFLEFAWSPGDMIQAEDRLHRIGQTGSVTVWNLIAEDTIEEHIITLLENKRCIMETVHDGQVSDNEYSILKELAKAVLQSR